jgi:hypothetical protein
MDQKLACGVVDPSRLFDLTKNIAPQKIRTALAKTKRAKPDHTTQKTPPICSQAACLAE